MEKIRHPAVAGMFYPGNAHELRAAVDKLLGAASAKGANGASLHRAPRLDSRMESRAMRQGCSGHGFDPIAEGAPPKVQSVHPCTAPLGSVQSPKAIIAPHAGYIYSGPVAASVYARLKPLRGVVQRVVLLGPSHRVGFEGVALSSADCYETPLGRIALDRPAVEALADLPSVRVFDAAHAREHSLEVHLPFLQAVLGELTLVPLVVGDAAPGQVAQVLERLWGGPETLIVVSSDLSHYHDYATARRLDAATSQAIEQMRFEDIGYDDACGRIPVSGLLHYARHHGFRVQTIDLRNSGDTAGGRDRVVGYGAYAIQ
jgi:AmmeMemoRadiSam system protein B